MGKDLGNPASYGGRIRNKSDALMDSISTNLPWSKFGGRSGRTSKKINIRDILPIFRALGFNKGGAVLKSRRKQTKYF